MLVVENVDNAAFNARLKPDNAPFEKEFGKNKIDAIRNYK
jgi:hypothetical protein